MTSSLGPGATIGVLGSGQLGRMLGLVARRMGYRFGCYGGDRTTPCGQISDFAFDSAIDDEDQLKAFAEQCDVVTYEFENVPAATAATIEQFAPLNPNSDLLATAQNRLLEKNTLQKLGIPTAHFRAITSADLLKSARNEFGARPILKTATDGYDGKGQWTIGPETDCHELWDSNGLHDTILEERIDFEYELSIIGGRFRDGKCYFYRPSINHHENHILDVSLSADSLIGRQLKTQAETICQALLEHFKVIGVLCVELFLTTDGRLLVNEIAPRPHNSGHLTIESCTCSQFELQLRTICNQALSTIESSPAAAMVNLLGQHLPNSRSRAQTPPTSYFHDYGKSEARRDRKMGHITAIGSEILATEATARAARDVLRATI